MGGRRGTRVLAALAVVLLLLAIWVLIFQRDSPEGPRHAAPASNDPVARACDIDPDMLQRIERGHYPGRSEDITFVPYEPNYLGSFSVTSHSGPWDYLQRVPLVLYGPNRVAPIGQVADEATLADVYPTVEKWTAVPLEQRTGKTLDRAVAPNETPPKLLVFVMWDGVGRNVLERWPDAWPTLKRLEQEGLSYVQATAGSSPSITPATHATLGTGAFPEDHGLTAIKYRGDDGTMKTAFEGRDPSDLELSTFADQIDLAFDNRSQVGLVGFRIWHMPMMSHGAGVSGADKDQLALIGLDGKFTGNSRLYDTPDYVRGLDTLDSRIDELDQADGVKDGEWREHPIASDHDNPAWAAYENDVIFEMWERERYGEDAVPDMFFVNYKMTDVVGHQYSMDSPEMEEVLRAQDAALGELVEYLDSEVGDYALVVSADHGHTPSPEISGGWPLSAREMVEDVNARFSVEDGESLISTTAVGLFVKDEVAEQYDVSKDEIAEFLNGYTIAENWPDSELPKGYEGRGEEIIFEAAFPSEDLGEILTCAGLRD